MIRESQILHLAFWHAMVEKEKIPDLGWRKERGLGFPLPCLTRVRVCVGGGGGARTLLWCGHHVLRVCLGPSPFLPVFCALWVTLPAVEEGKLLVKEFGKSNCSLKAVGCVLTGAARAGHRMAGCWEKNPQVGQSLCSWHRFLPSTGGQVDYEYECILESFPLIQTLLPCPTPILVQNILKAGVWGEKIIG